MEHVIACINEFGDRNIHVMCDNMAMAELIACELSIKYSRMKWCIVSGESDFVTVYEIGEKSVVDVSRAE